MDWRWSWFWSLLWNVLIHAVTLNWTALQQDGNNIRSWWQSLWGEITSRIDGLKAWAQSQLSTLAGQAYALYVLALNWINSQIAGVRNWAQGQLGQLSGYAYSLYILALNWINSQINTIRSWVQGLINAVYAWARPYIDTAVNAVRALYAWVQPYQWLITQFLAGARGAIDWLWHTAMGQLQAFLSNPLGYVLGILLTPLRNWINFYNQYGPLLQNFVANELTEWATTWANGKRVLKALLSDPELFFFDLLAPRLLNWLEEWIAERW